MTEYVKSTNFASKDSLAVGTPLKIVKGTEIDTEFNNIATAVATKADIANPTFTGTVAAPTPALSAAGTTVATVATIQSLYPVGSIYINAGVTTNPATLLGFGTWVAFGAGKVLVGQDTGDASFDVLEETGGSKDAIVVAHTHTGTTANAGTHTHSLIQGREFTPVYGANEGIGIGGYALETGRGSSEWTNTTQSAGDHNHSFTTNSTGSSGTSANLQPYVVVKMWKRTA